MIKIDKFKDDYAYLSNFFHAPLTVLGIPFQNSESAYMACKTLDIEERQKFSNVPGNVAKKMGRKLILRPGWDDGILKVECMELCLRSKFQHNPHLAVKLASTGDIELIEGNTWGDTFWGVCGGQGENMLGKLLMEVRKSYQN
jgi:ribA/ribD-fused uncharacterized protein